MKFLEDVPIVLYKYRDFSNENHKTLLFDQALYFAAIEQFNDPFDGTIPFRYDPADLTEDNIFKKYELMARREHPDWGDRQIHELCYDYQRRGHFKDDRYLEKFEKETFDDINNRYGIVALAKNPDNFLLWSHYSNSHTGFCMGFDKYELWHDTGCQFAHMQYTEEIPRLGLFENVPDTFTKLIGTKSRTWEYELEYRLTKIDAAKKVIKLNKKTVREIHFGCKMSQGVKFELIDKIKDLYPDASVFESKLSQTKFELEVHQIM